MSTRALEVNGYLFDRFLGDNPIADYGTIVINDGLLEALTAPPPYPFSLLSNEELKSDWDEIVSALHGWCIRKEISHIHAQQRRVSVGAIPAVFKSTLRLFSNSLEDLKRVTGYKDYLERRDEDSPQKVLAVTIATEAETIQSRRLALLQRELSLMKGGMDAYLTGSWEELDQLSRFARRRDACKW